MEFQQLSMLLAVVDSGGYTQAGKTLSISHSAIHESLKALEEFGYTQSPQVSAAKMRELAEGGYLERAEPADGEDVFRRRACGDVHLRSRRRAAYRNDGCRRERELSEKKTMVSGRHKFRVSADELEYLNKLALGDESLVSSLRRAEGLPGGKLAVKLGRSEAEKLREHLTERLARVGFEGDYSLTGEGKIIEELVDRFYLP